MGSDEEGWGAQIFASPPLRAKIASAIFLLFFFLLFFSVRLLAKYGRFNFSSFRGRFFSSSVNFTGDSSPPPRPPPSLSPLQFASRAILLFFSLFTGDSSALHFVSRAILLLLQFFSSIQPRAQFKNGVKDRGETRGGLPAVGRPTA